MGLLFIYLFVILIVIIVYYCCYYGCFIPLSPSCRAFAARREGNYRTDARRARAYVHVAQAHDLRENTSTSCN